MSSILDLEIFVRVADSGSISAAARGLELTPALTEVPRNRRRCAALRRAERFNAGGVADSAAAPARRLRQP